MTEVTKTMISKLSGTVIDSRIRELVGAGKSLSEIKAALSPVAVSRQAIHKKIIGLGLTLLHRSFGADVPAAPGIGRPVSAAVMRKYRHPERKRNPPWLSAFKKEIGDMLIGGLYSYAEIWDELQRRHPIVPQFSKYTDERDKGVRIAVWVIRERKKATGAVKTKKWRSA